MLDINLRLYVSNHNILNVLQSSDFKFHMMDNSEYENSKILHAFVSLKARKFLQDLGFTNLRLSSCYDNNIESNLEYKDCDLKLAVSLVHDVRLRIVTQNIMMTTYLPVLSGVNKISDKLIKNMWRHATTMAKRQLDRLSNS